MRVKHVLKVGTITGLTGTGTLSLPAGQEVTAMKGAWIVFNCTALGGGTTPSVAVNIMALFSDLWVKVGSVTVTSTTVPTLFNSHESIAAAAAGVDIRFDWTMAGSPTSNSTDVYISLF